MALKKYCPHIKVFFHHTNDLKKALVSQSDFLGLLRFTFLGLRLYHRHEEETGEPQLRDHNEDATESENEQKVSIEASLDKPAPHVEMGVGLRT